MDYLPNLCMAPGFIPHCPKCIIYISPLCLLNTAPLLSFLLAAFPCLLPTSRFSLLLGGRRKAVSPVYCWGGGRGKFQLSVIWGGGDITRCSGIASWDFHHCPGISILRTPPSRNWRWTDKESDQCSRTLAYSPRKMWEEGPEYKGLCAHLGAGRMLARGLRSGRRVRQL